MEMLKDALRLLRIFHDMSQTDLAEQLGVSKSLLSQIESGGRRPTLDLLEGYAKVFNLPISSILFFSEQLESNKLSERTRVKVADKVVKLMEFIAARSDGP